METVVGHEPIRHFFETVLHNGNIHHAYCLVGPEHVGKRLVAETVAAELLRTSRAKLSTMPDYFFLHEEMNEKTGKLRQEITVEQVRTLRSFLQQRSFFGGYKVAVVDHAHTMGASAANAFLKTLEEPAQKTILFLVVEDEEAVPSTILSRCHALYFSLVPDAALRAIATNMLSAKDADALVWISRGRPGLLRTWTADTETYEKALQEVRQFEQLWSGGLADRFLAIEQIFKKEEDEAMGREQLQKILALWEFLLRHILRVRVKTESVRLSLLGIHENVPLRTLVTALHSVRQAKRLLAENIHPRLVIENTILAFP